MQITNQMRHQHILHAKIIFGYFEINTCFVNKRDNYNYTTWLTLKIWKLISEGFFLNWWELLFHRKEHSCKTGKETFWDLDTCVMLWNSSCWIYCKIKAKINFQKSQVLGLSWSINRTVLLFTWRAIQSNQW